VIDVTGIAKGFEVCTCFLFDLFINKKHRKRVSGSTQYIINEKRSKKLCAKFLFFMDLPSILKAQNLSDFKSGIPETIAVTKTKLYSLSYKKNYLLVL